VVHWAGCGSPGSNDVSDAQASPALEREARHPGGRLRCEGSSSATKEKARCRPGRQVRQGAPQEGEWAPPLCEDRWMPSASSRPSLEMSATGVLRTIGDF
jgi:hypothetical protein